MLKPTELLTVIKARPDILPHLSAEAKIHAFGESAYYKAYERDPKEPGRKRKMAYERKFADLMMRIFDRQKEDVTPQIIIALQTKASDYNLDWTDEEKRAFTTLVMEMYIDGVDLFRQDVFDGLSDQFVNVGAQKAAREYALKLVNDLKEQLNQTTLNGIKESIAQFAEPGVTIGDVMSQINKLDIFSAERTLRIAVTEITRAYATANQMAGEQAQREFPDLTIEKTWYTNVDDKTCAICGPLHMTSVGINESWAGIDNPPAHVHCRCWTNYGSTLGKI